MYISWLWECLNDISPVAYVSNKHQVATFGALFGKGLILYSFLREIEWAGAPKLNSSSSLKKRPLFILFHLSYLRPNQWAKEHFLPSINIIVWIKINFHYNTPIISKRKNVNLRPKLFFLKNQNYCVYVWMFNRTLEKNMSTLSQQKMLVFT